MWVIVPKPSFDRDDIVMCINGVSSNHSMAADNDDNEAGLI